jgi:Fe-S oxidoreductase
LQPGATLALYRRLQAITPTLGMLLDCCHKISHDLGRTQIHEEYLAYLVHLLDAHGINTLVTACPSCLQAFGGLPARFTVTTAYRLLNISPSAGRPHLSPGTSFTIHDPCSVRFHPLLQDDVRQLCLDLGIPIEEMDHARAATFCCGEGGGAGFIAPHLAEAWRQQRAAEIGDRTVITYCAGCTARLGGQQPAIHLTELLTATGSSRPLQPFRPIGPLRRWLNRLWLKLMLYRDRLVHRQP